MPLTLVSRGLRTFAPPPSTPGNAYVAEDGTTAYVTEDGATSYVQEI